MFGIDNEHLFTLWCISCEIIMQVKTAGISREGDARCLEFKLIIAMPFCSYNV